MSQSIFNNTNTNTNFSDNIVNDMTNYLINFKSYENIYNNTDDNLESYDNSMICQSCYSTVLSKTHANCCNTIEMYQMKKSIIDDNFTPMMTYGLGGCTALIMINKNTIIEPKVIEPKVLEEKTSLSLEPIIIIAKPKIIIDKPNRTISRDIKHKNIKTETKITKIFRK